jgi:uncharacterized protein
MVEAFWDASALVPICTGQISTPRAVKHYQNYDIVIWWATPVEIAGAFARLMNMKLLSSKAHTRARTIAAKLAGEWAVVRPSDFILRRATDVITRHNLRAGDALQLAAALEWCQDQPQGVTFLTGDHRLRQVALSVGFDAKTV